MRKLISGKDFERLFWKKYENGPHVAHVYLERTPDGMTPIGGGRYAPTIKTSADFTGHRLQDGRVVYVECKLVSANKEGNPGKSFGSLEPPPQFRGIRAKSYRMPWHQQEAILRAWRCGGVGLLIVAFEGVGIYALDGLGLSTWVNGDDANGNQSSISLKHFSEYGRCLGDLEREKGGWSLDEWCWKNEHEKYSRQDTKPNERGSSVARFTDRVQVEADTP